MLYLAAAAEEDVDVHHRDGAPSEILGTTTLLLATSSPPFVETAAALFCFPFVVVFVFVDVVVDFVLVALDDHGFLPPFCGWMISLRGRRRTRLHFSISTRNESLFTIAELYRDGKKASPRLRDPMPWFPLDVEASSRNQGPIFMATSETIRKKAMHVTHACRL